MYVDLNVCFSLVSENILHVFRQEQIRLMFLWHSQPFSDTAEKVMGEIELCEPWNYCNMPALNILTTRLFAVFLISSFWGRSAECKCHTVCDRDKKPTHPPIWNSIIGIHLCIFISWRTKNRDMKLSPNDLHQQSFGYFWKNNFTFSQLTT